MIPTYAKAAKQVLREEETGFPASSLARFIYEFEPNEIDKYCFRELLADVIADERETMEECLTILEESLAEANTTRKYLLASLVANACFLLAIMYLASQV